MPAVTPNSLLRQQPDVVIADQHGMQMLLRFKALQQALQRRQPPAPDKLLRTLRQGISRSLNNRTEIATGVASLSRQLKSQDIRRPLHLARSLFTYLHAARPFAFIQPAIPS